MDIKEYLNQIQRYEKIINNKLEEIEHLKLLATSISASTYGIHWWESCGYTPGRQLFQWRKVLHCDRAKHVTDDCSYTITESENVTGIWDKATHTYTVSEVTADNVWVDIKAVYLNALAITRRFSVSKQKSGTPGRTYVLESSTTILKRESENSITPNVVIFSAYYRDGENTGRTDYAGRFVIEETSDGKTWETAYSSVTDETSVNYYVDYIFADSDGVLIADSDGSLIGARSKDIVGLRCSLYASGGTTNLIDTVKLDVITEVTALTQEDILKLLTNDGEWKGIYKGADGELYISFSAAMGGLLKLGGKNNGNGVLHIYDDDGKVKATLNYNGLVVYENPLNPDPTESQTYSGLLFDGASIHPVKGNYKFSSHGAFLLGKICIYYTARFNNSIVKTEIFFIFLSIKNVVLSFCPINLHKKWYN